MSELTLHYALPSRGITVLWMLEELGIEYSKNLLSLEKEEHKTEAFLVFNPMGRVPVLTHDDTVVTETAAIVAYLAETFSQGKMEVPIGDKDRGSYLRWLFYASGSAEPSMLWASLGKVTAERDYLPFADMESVTQTLVSAVSGKSYVVADRFTAADVMLGSTIMWAMNLMPTLPQLPELTSYWGNLEQRPAWQKTWAQVQAALN